MAAANYRLCDRCGAKTFYDSDVDYEDSNLGAMAALCKDCAQTHEITIAKRGEVAELRAAAEAWGDAHRHFRYVLAHPDQGSSEPYLWAEHEFYQAEERLRAALATTEGEA